MKLHLTIYAIFAENINFKIPGAAILLEENTNDVLPPRDE